MEEGPDHITMMKVAFLLGLLAFVAGRSSEEYDYSSEEYGSSEVSYGIFIGVSIVEYKKNLKSM